MPYDNIISRTDAAATIPEDVAAQILTGTISQSAALTLFPRTTMSAAQQRMPVISALPTAYFVNGDTGQKQTTEAAWANKYLNAEEIAAIVPIPENVLDDSSFDVWGTIRPLLEEAAGRALDAAVFFGTNKPSSWPDAIVTSAVAAGNTVNRGTNNAAAGGLAQDFSDLFALVEADGYDVDGVILNRSLRGALRSVRNSQGDQQQGDVNARQIFYVEGDRIQYPMRGLWPAIGTSTSTQAIVGDFSEGIVAVRKDFTYKILTEAVIQDSSGNIVFNLAQQDMVALRLTFRVAWQIKNIINRDQPTEANRYPFGVLRTA